MQCDLMQQARRQAPQYYDHCNHLLLQQQPENSCPTSHMLLREAVRVQALVTLSFYVIYSVLPSWDVYCMPGLTLVGN